MRKNYKPRAKGIGSDSLVPIKSTSEEKEEVFGDLKKYELERERMNKRVQVRMEDLKSLLRCAQIVQMGLNNRLNDARNVGGDVSKVDNLSKRHRLVFDMMSRVIQDVEKQNGFTISPNSFI